LADTTKESLFSELDERLDSLFGEDAAEQPGDTMSPLESLKGKIMTVDWEISDKTLASIEEEVRVLRRTFGSDKAVMLLLKMLSSLAGYIRKYKGDSHPESVQLFHKVAKDLFRITETKGLNLRERNAIVRKDIDRFQELKGELSRSRKPPTEPYRPSPALFKETAAQPSSARDPEGSIPFDESLLFDPVDRDTEYSGGAAGRAAAEPSLSEVLETEEVSTFEIPESSSYDAKTLAAEIQDLESLLRAGAESSEAPVERLSADERVIEQGELQDPGSEHTWSVQTVTERDEGKAAPEAEGKEWIDLESLFQDELAREKTSAETPASAAGIFPEEDAEAPDRDAQPESRRSAVRSGKRGDFSDLEMYDMEGRGAGDLESLTDGADIEGYVEESPMEIAAFPHGASRAIRDTVGESLGEDLEAPAVNRRAAEIGFDTGEWDRLVRTITDFRREVRSELAGLRSEIFETRRLIDEVLQERISVETKTADTGAPGYFSDLDISGTDSREYAPESYEHAYEDVERQGEREALDLESSSLEDLFEEAPIEEPDAREETESLEELFDQVPDRDLSWKQAAPEFSMTPESEEAVSLSHEEKPVGALDGTSSGIQEVFPEAGELDFQFEAEEDRQDRETDEVAAGAGGEGFLVRVSLGGTHYAVPQEYVVQIGKLKRRARKKILRKGSISLEDVRSPFRSIKKGVFPAWALLPSRELSQMEFPLLSIEDEEVLDSGEQGYILLKAERLTGALVTDEIPDVVDANEGKGLELLSVGDLLSAS